MCFITNSIIGKDVKGTIFYKIYVNAKILNIVKNTISDKNLRPQNENVSKILSFIKIKLR